MNVQIERLKMAHKVRLQMQELVGKCVFQEGISTIHGLEVEKNIDKYTELSINNIIQSIDNFYSELTETMSQINAIISILNLSDLVFMDVMKDAIMQQQRKMQPSRIITPN